MSGFSRLSSFLASVATQVRMAIEMGVPVDDTVSGANQTDERESASGQSGAYRWDDAPGYMTRSGLGSLEIGADTSQFDE